MELGQTMSDLMTSLLHLYAYILWAFGFVPPQTQKLLICSTYQYMHDYWEGVCDELKEHLQGRLVVTRLVHVLLIQLL